MTATEWALDKFNKEQRAKSAQLDAIPLELREAAELVGKTGTIRGALALPPETFEKAREFERRATAIKLAHMPDCRCVRCFRGDVECRRCHALVPGGYPGLGRHIRGDHNRKPAKLRRKLVADGFGYLLKGVRDPSLAGRFDLAALTRFQVALLGGPGAPAPKGRSKKFVRSDRTMLAHFKALDEKELVLVPRPLVTAPMGEAVYQLALLAGVAPYTVVGALICYGLEHLAQEMRASQKAPRAAPTVRVVQAPQVAAPTFDVTPLIGEKPRKKLFPIAS